MLLYSVRQYKINRHRSSKMKKLTKNQIKDITNNKIAFEYIILDYRTSDLQRKQVIKSVLNKPSSNRRLYWCNF